VSGWRWQSRGCGESEEADLTFGASMGATAMADGEGGKSVRRQGTHVVLREADD
jgi:hypothetical protein